MQLKMKTVLISLVVLAGCGQPDRAGELPDFVAGDLITFTGQTSSPNGAWCWFQDERAIVDPGHPDGPMLMFTAISASAADSSEQGDLDLHFHGLDSGIQGVVELHDRLEQDDHNVAALHQLDTGEVLAVFARHGSDRIVRTVRSGVHDPTHWSQQDQYTEDAAVTYSNLLTAGEGSDRRLLNFSRSRGWNPNFVVYDDALRSWTYGGRLLASEGRPYLKYRSNLDGSAIHVVATDQHPRDFNNSIHHGVTDGMTLSDSFGKVLDPDLTDQDAPEPAEMTLVFSGDPDNVAWVADVEVDDYDRPVIAFSVQKDGRGLPPRQGGLDHRYHLARFIDGDWVQHEIAFAGERLYSGEDDYTGLVAIDPQDVDHLVISTNADPVTGRPLNADGLRHYELFEGRSADGGASFAWTALTANSTVDNIRPIIPDWESDRRIVLWMRGTYRSYTDWDTQIVGVVQDRGAERPGSSKLAGTAHWRVPARWIYEDSTLWTFDGDILNLTTPGTIPKDIRRPGAVATAAGSEAVGSFHLMARVQSTQDTTIAGRDVILVFGYQSPRQFYYAHLSKDNTAQVHNGIFVVDNSDRRRIDDQGLENAPEARLTDTAWHRVRMDRDVDSGKIRVFMDDLREPLMTATDTTFRVGAIGFGSFDDTGAIRDVRYTEGPPPAD